MRLFIKKNKNILISLGTNLLLVLLAIFAFGARYAVDDDVAMARIAYGVFFEPQTRLVFTCNVFGAVLKGLSSLADGVNWQLILYYVSLLYGGSVSFYYVLKKNRRLLSILWVLVVTSFYYATYININFSVITSMLAFFGYVTLFYGAYAKEKTPVIMSAITLIFAMSIRYESFFVFSLFAFFAFVLIFIHSVSKYGVKTAINGYVVPFSVALFLPLFLFAVDRASYLGDEWVAYTEYNDNRSQILDFQSVLKNEDQRYFDEIGLSKEMVESLKNWQFNDTEIFSEQLISKMSEDSKKYNPKLTSDFIFAAVGYSVEKICKLYYFAFGVLFLALLTIRRDKVGKGYVHVFALPWIIMVPLIAEICLYYFLDRGIDRVLRTTGLGFWCGITVLLCCDYFESNGDENILNKKWLIVATALIAVLGVCLQANKLRNTGGFKLVEKQKVDEELSFLLDGKIYMCDIGSIREIEQAYGVWQAPNKGFLYNCVELGGWMVNYPCVKEKQNSLGVSNPYKSLAYNDNAYLLTTEDGNIQLEFLRSAYNKNIESELVEKHGNLSVYKYSVK